MSVQRTLYILLFAFVLISGFSVSSRSHPKKCTSLECDINEDAGSPAIKVAKRDLLPSLQQPNELGNTIVTSDFSKKNNHHINMLSSSKINDVRGHVMVFSKKSDRHAQKKTKVNKKKLKSSSSTKTRHHTPVVKNKSGDKAVKNTLNTKQGGSYVQDAPNQPQFHAIPIHHNRKLLDNIGKRLSLINRIESKLKTAYNIHPSNTTTSSSKKKKIAKNKSLPTSTIHTTLKSLTSASAAKPTTSIASGKNQKIMVLISKNGNMISLNRFKKLQSKGLVKGITPVYVRDSHGKVLFAVPVARKLKNKNYMLSKKLIMVSNEELKGFLERYNLELPETRNHQGVLPVQQQQHHQFQQSQPQFHQFTQKQQQQQQQLKAGINSAPKPSSTASTSTPIQTLKQQNKNQIRNNMKPTASMSTPHQQKHQQKQVQPTVSQQGKHVHHQHKQQFHHNKPTARQSPTITAGKQHHHKPTVSSSTKHNTTPMKAAKYHHGTKPTSSSHQYAPTAKSSSTHGYHHHQAGGHARLLAPHHERASKKNITDLQVIDGNEFTINDEAVNGGDKATTISTDPAMARELIDDGEIVPVSSESSKASKESPGRGEEIEEKMLKMEAFFKENNDTNKIIDSSISRNKVNTNDDDKNNKRKGLSLNQTYIVDLTAEPEVESSKKDDGIKSEDHDSPLQPNSTETSPVAKSPDNDSANKTSSSPSEVDSFSSLSTTNSANETSSSSSSTNKKPETVSITDSSDLFESKDFIDEDQDETFTLSFLPNTTTSSSSGSENANSTKTSDDTQGLNTTSENATSKDSQTAENLNNNTTSSISTPSSSSSNNILSGDGSLMHDQQLSDELAEADAVSMSSSTSLPESSNTNNSTVVGGEKSSTVSSNDTSSTKEIIHDSQIEDELDEAEGGVNAAKSTPKSNANTNTDIMNNPAPASNTSSSPLSEDHSKKLSGDEKADHEVSHYVKNDTKTNVELKKHHHHQDTDSKHFLNLSNRKIEEDQKIKLENEEDEAHITTGGSRDSVKDKKEKAKDKDKAQVESESRQSAPADYQETQCRPCHSDNPYDLQITQKTPSMPTNNEYLPPPAAYPSPLFSVHGKSNPVIPVGNLNLLPCCRDNIEEPSKGQSLSVNSQSKVTNTEPFQESLPVAPVNDQADANAANTESSQQDQTASVTTEQPDQAVSANNNPYPAPKIDNPQANRHQSSNQLISNAAGAEGSSTSPQQQVLETFSIEPDTSQFQAQTPSVSDQPQQIQSTAESASNQPAFTVTEQQQIPSTGASQQYQNAVSGEPVQSQAQYQTPSALESNQAAGLGAESSSLTAQQQYMPNGASYASFAQIPDTGNYVQQPQPAMQEITSSYAPNAAESVAKSSVSFENFENMSAFQQKKALMAYNKANPTIAPPQATAATDSSNPTTEPANLNSEAANFAETGHSQSQQQQAIIVATGNHKVATVSSSQEYVEATKTPAETQQPTTTTTSKTKFNNSRFKYPIKNFDFDDDAEKDDDEVEAEEEEEEIEEKKKSKKKVASKDQKKQVQKSSKVLPQQRQKQQKASTNTGKLPVNTFGKKATKHQAPLQRHTTSSTEGSGKPGKSSKDTKTPPSKNNKEKAAYLKELSTILKESKELSKALQDQANDYLRGKSPDKTNKNPALKNVKQSSSPSTNKPTADSPILSNIALPTTSSSTESTVTPGQIPQNLASFETLLDKIKKTTQQQLQAYYQQQFAARSSSSNRQVASTADQYSPAAYYQQLQQYQQTPQPFYSNPAANAQQQQYYYQNPLQQNSEKYERMPTAGNAFASSSSSYTDQSSLVSPDSSQFQQIATSYSQQQDQDLTKSPESTIALNTASIANDKNFGLDSVKTSSLAYAASLENAEAPNGVETQQIDQQQQQSSFYPTNTNPTVPSSHVNGMSRNFQPSKDGQLKEQDEVEDIHSYPSPKITVAPNAASAAAQVKKQPVDPLAGWSKAVTRDNTQPRPKQEPLRKQQQRQQAQTIQQQQQPHGFLQQRQQQSGRHFSEKSYFINNGISDETHHEKAMNFLSSFLKHISTITHNPSFWKKEEISQQQHTTHDTVGSKRDIVLGPVINELEEASR